MAKLEVLISWAGIALISTASHIVPKTSTGIWLSTRLFWRTMGGLGTVMRLGRQSRRK
jgi:hypothetical protein